MSASNWVAWSAGFFEGEGCISIVKSSSQGRTIVQLRCAVEQVDPEPLRRLESLFGGRTKRFDRANRPSNHSVTWRWQIGTQQAAAFLQAIEPFISRSKLAKKIRLALDFQGQKTHGNYGRPAGEDYHRRQDAYHVEMKKLNEKGTTYGT
jgi:hypothetical protein